MCTPTKRNPITFALNWTAAPVIRALTSPLETPTATCCATLAPMTLPKIAVIVMALAIGVVPAEQQTYVLKAARLFDSTTGMMMQPGIVTVTNDKVQSIGGSAIPSGATVIDLQDATLLPGFIDAHTHLTADFDPDYDGAQLRALQRTVAEQAIRAADNARKTLMAGFTTVRDLGSGDFLDVGLRDAIEAGIAVGPRMLVAVNA